MALHLQDRDAARQRTARQDHVDPPRSTRGAIAANDGVLANERLTASTGVLLLLGFAAEGLTILLGVKAVLPAHVFIGVVLVPPVLLKVAVTTYRMVRYYGGDPAYVDRGPPMWLLRVAGPLVVLSTVLVLVTGIAAVVIDPRPEWAETGHKTGVLVWAGLMAVHVLGHARETPAKATADWRRGRVVSGRRQRVAVIAGAVALGVALGLWSLTWHLVTGGAG
jgi:hypothetical protein